MGAGMERLSALRIVAALAVAAVGLALAMLMRAPAAAALLALLAGIACCAVAFASRRDRPPLAETHAEQQEDALPGIAELLRAIGEPMLVVRDGRVAAANEAALALL